MYFDLYKKFYYYHSKSLDQALAHCPIFLTAIPWEFSFCFRTNQAKYSWKFAKDLRLERFMPSYKSNLIKAYFIFYI